MISLNEEERDIVMHVLHSFKSQILSLRIHLFGATSVSKITVSKSIYQLVTHYFTHQPSINKIDDPINVLLTAPSRKAVF